MADPYLHLAWLVAVVVCSLVVIALVAGLFAVVAPDPDRRADAYKVLVAILPMFRRSQVARPRTSRKKPPETLDGSTTSGPTPSG